jgi:hypothetical protein
MLCTYARRLQILGMWGRGLLKRALTRRRQPPSAGVGLALEPTFESRSDQAEIENRPSAPWSLNVPLVKIKPCHASERAATDDDSVSNRPDNRTLSEFFTLYWRTFPKQLSSLTIVLACMYDSREVSSALDLALKYRKEWDLFTIPFDAIPDDLLRSWWAKRSVTRREYKIKPAPDKTTAEKRRAQREYRRRRRAAGKDK